MSPVGDALHRAVLVVEHFGRREAGEDLHAERFGLAGEPAADIAERSGEGALVRHEGRHHDVRKLVLLLLGEHPMPVLDDGNGERTVELAPIGDELVEPARIDDRARQDVSADFRALFEDADRKLAALFLGELLEADARGKAGGSRADDHHIISHRLAFRHLSSPFRPARGLRRNPTPAGR
jgi:hypothetical protein